MSLALNLAVKRLIKLALVVTCWVATSWVVTSGVVPLQCATLERLSLDDMITRSTGIVRGNVTATWAAFTGSVIYTHYTIQVSESFKGTARNSVEIMVPGGTVNGLHQNFSGSPSLNRGDEFVFFLWTSKGGITWITGLTQGLFALSANADSTAARDRIATRLASRELMLDAATSQAVKDSALSLKLNDLRTRIAATLAATAGAR